MSNINNLDPDCYPHVAKNWFHEWFDSPFYHILYQHRDELEARSFIDLLIDLLQPDPHARILDLACGKGRYSRYLAEKGFEVTGLDLSEKSIAYARQFETDRLTFYTHDMRMPFRTNYYDLIFNFFTSFGYFDLERDDINTLKSVATGLRPDGLFVLDFFNSFYVRSNLTGKEEKKIQGITFHINKFVEGQHVIKVIEFDDGGEHFFFKEKVRLFSIEDFDRLFRAADLSIIRTFGDYQLRSFDIENSPRLIMIAQKND